LRYRLDGFIVVDTDDALLICPKEREQEVREVVKQLEKVSMIPGWHNRSASAHKVITKQSYRLQSRDWLVCN